MTREECERGIIGLLVQILDLYKQYSPDGQLCMSVNTDGHASAFNQYWEGGINFESPINTTLFQDGQLKICDEYVPYAWQSDE